VDDSEAWKALLAGLDRLGERILGNDFSDDPASRDAAYRYLAQQLLCWLEWSVGYGDPSRPAFQRQNDLVTAWGGPNADNVYRHARISPRHVYRVAGRMNSCQEFALAIREGFRHTDRPATVAELTASDIGIGPDDPFELILGGSGDQANRIPLPEGAIMCSIREYYFDWRPREPATFTIECVDGDPAPPPSFASSIEEALDLTERSLGYWNDYVVTARARQSDNQFKDKIDVPRGLQLSQFLFCFCELDVDQALVVECEVPDARYWSFQLYDMQFFGPLDISRPTSMNHRQATLSGDDKVRVVVAHEDPGVPNWLDTMGLPRVLLNYRHFWGSQLPTPRTQLVPVEGIRSALPSGTRMVDASEREAELELRRDHLAWRFRT
jgi:hypothetical protein